MGHMLSGYFKSHGWDAAVLSREKRNEKNFFYWNPVREEMDEAAFENISCIISLAGVSIAGKRWTRKRKQEIINSRIQSTDFLYEKLRTVKNNVKTFISASGTGYYGNRKDEWLTEVSAPGNDFLSTCCRYWEGSALKVSTLGIRTVIFRIGIVLSREEGALPKLALPVKLFVGSPLGSGRQFISWIHYADLSALFFKAADDSSLQGIYNAVAPEPVTNKEFIKILAKTLHRPMFLPPVPSFILKIILGELATAITGGQRVSGQKITDAGFRFQFSRLDEALRNIYSE